MKSLSIIPFKIARVQANELFVLKQSFFEKSIFDYSSNLLTHSVSDIKQVYLPFYGCVVTNLTSKYTGRYGIDRTEYYVSPKDKRVQTRIVTDWYLCSGTIYNATYKLQNATQIYAGFTYPRMDVESTFQNHIPPLIETKEIREPFDRYEMKTSYAHQLLTAKIIQLQSMKAIENIKKKYSADHGEVINIDVELNNINFELYHYYLPYYIYTIDNQFIKYMNGYNGYICGDITFSYDKVIAVGTLMGGLLPLLFGGPILRGAIMIGLSSGVITKMYTTLKRISNEYILNSEKEHNNSMNDSAFDQYVNVSVHKFEDEVYDLFELDRNEKITPQMLKDAYYKQLMKYHPDVCDGGLKKTQQLNDAYRKAIFIIRNN